MSMQHLSSSLTSSVLGQTQLFVTGDIGGTNTRLQLYSVHISPLNHLKRFTSEQVDSGEPGREELLGEDVYSSRAYPTIEEVIELFLARYNTTKLSLHSICLAVAGPVENNEAHVTNLTWLISGENLVRHFKLKSARIINDFVGIGYGLLALQPHELQTIHPGSIQDRTAPKAVIGAGTGLGECFLTFNGKSYDVWPSEGGHSDFSPRNQVEFEILEYVKKNQKIDRLSIERVTSGLGLEQLYAFFSEKRPGQANPEVAAQIKSKSADPKVDVGKIIGTNAESGQCPVCVEAMDTFISLYGAEAGNLALKTLPFGGLYIAGGIAAKNMKVMLKNNQFVESFLAKGRMSKRVLERIPIHLILNNQVGLLGSKVICRRMIHTPELEDPNKLHKQLPSKL